MLDLTKSVQAIELSQNYKPVDDEGKLIFAEDVSFDIEPLTCEEEIRVMLTKDDLIGQVVERFRYGVKKIYNISVDNKMIEDSKSFIDLFRENKLDKKCIILLLTVSNEIATISSVKEQVTKNSESSQSSSVVTK